MKAIKMNMNWDEIKELNGQSLSTDDLSIVLDDSEDVFNYENCGLGSNGMSWLVLTNRTSGEEVNLYEKREG